MSLVGSLVRDVRSGNRRVGYVVQQESEWVRVEFGIYCIWVQQKFVELVNEGGEGDQRSDNHKS